MLGRTDPATPYSALTYASNNNLWQYVANSRGYTEIKSSGTGIRAHGSIGEISVGVQNPNKTDNQYKSYWIAFEIDVPKTGYYSISVDATPFGYGTSTYIDAYLFDVNSVMKAYL